MKRILKYALIALIVGVTLVTYINRQDTEIFDTNNHRGFSDTIAEIREQRRIKKGQGYWSRNRELAQLVIERHPDLIEDGFVLENFFVDKGDLFNQHPNVTAHFVKKKSVYKKYRGRQDGRMVDVIYQKMVMEGDEKKYFFEYSVVGSNSEPYVYLYETDTKILLKDLQPFPLIKSFDSEILVKDNPEIQRYFLHNLDLLGGELLTSIYPEVTGEQIKIQYRLFTPVRQNGCYYCGPAEQYISTITFDKTKGIISQETSNSFFGVQSLIEKLPNFDRYITKLPIKDRIYDVEFQKQTENGLSEKIYDISDYVPLHTTLESGEHDISEFINDYVESMEAQGYTQKY